MRNADRKGKVFIPPTVESLSIANIRRAIELKFPALQDQPFVLRYYLPGLMINPKKFRDDEEVKDIFLNKALLSNIQFFIEGHPGSFPPPSLPYLIGMDDPSDSKSYTMLSFYRFQFLDNPEEVSFELEKLWKPFRVFGRVYLAKEGINAQMAVPTNVIKNFQEACNTFK